MSDTQKMLVVLGAIVSSALLSIALVTVAGVRDPLLPVLLTVAASGWIASRLVDHA